MTAEPDTLGDLPEGLLVRINRRAKRISLRVDAQGQAILTLPNESFRAEGLRFARQKRNWLARHQASQPARVPLDIGSTIPVRGIPHRIAHNSGGRHPVSVSGTTVTLSGSAATAERLLFSWLTREAGSDLVEAVTRHTTALNLPRPPITLRDPKTRWGSCSSRKTLSLSWRLILAPAPVLDYVAAHECAHLIEMNHSKRFWALVERLSPDYRQHEAWLKQNGRDLHRYG